MTEKITFKEALEKYIHIGEFYYRGCYDDNALNIFKDMSETERKALLCGIHKVYFLVVKGELENPIIQAVDRPEVTKADRDAASNMATSSIFLMMLALFFILLVFGLFIVLLLDDSPSGAFRSLLKLGSFFIGT